ncbi:ATP-binding protein [Streptomyces sp. ADMS]|uniref:ATP-binding protein n=1 Tax=Streptomyces sp. ADMS TaxID=3071415 RepID=UPI00296F762D|nr:ATP-binding protein [Streptomyces sp. ADMS]MDW4907551.1 ATP-binding protein [Streptomyces sp. ADMS]
MPSNLPAEPDTLTPDQTLDSAVEHKLRLFDRRRTTPSAVRTFVTEALTQWGQTERLDDIRLCASELATNALLHGAPADGQVLVRVELHAALLRIEVHDSDNGTPTKREQPTTADDGRGLLLVSAVADHWGVSERQGPGKCVWAAFHHSVVPTC